MNTTLLRKLDWHLATDSGKMWAQALKSKYFASSSFLRCTRKKNASRTWISILHSQKLILNSLCYGVGKGNRISIWEDLWVPYNPNFKPLPTGEVRYECGLVEFLRHSNSEWNLEKLHNLFDSITMDNINRIPTTNNNLEDKLVWLGTKNGSFSVKSAYEMEFWKDFIESAW